ncbi:replication initiation protein (plasmid) [Thiothrix subterranea]|uniref:replication initiation protein n=1 Tax=Thiothrix subterranea TaxID=2735563 RepID=UPI00192A7D6C|nr:replication initiation protein [Thiothrix subterranea]QQZ31105.1 replication initiation protein [Thiothrix subterranea]
MTKVLPKSKRKLPPSTAVVTQSNELVSARYALPLGEMRLLFTVISKVQPGDTKLTVYRIPIGEFADFLGVARGSAYTEMKNITKSIVTRYVEIKSPGRLVQTTWVTQAEYIDGTGTVDVQLSESMIPHLLQLKNGNFTQCKLLMLLSFKSQYTLRLYMLLKQKRDHNPYAKTYDFELSDLRKILGVSVEYIPRADKFSKAQEAMELYPEYKVFKRCVLETARKELDTKADIGFNYDEIRHGRPVTALSFRVFAINRPGLLPALAAEEQLHLSLPASTDLDLVTTLLSFVPDQHRAKKGVRATIESAEKQHGFDYVKRNILYSNAHASKNYASYLNGALAIDYGHDWEIEQQQAAKAAETAKTPTVTLLELKALADDICALQRNSKLTNSPELWQQAEVLKAEYTRKREIYDEENTEEEEAS